MKKIVLSLLFIICFFVKPFPIYASGKPTFLIINQIRGGESCCESGTGDMFDVINAKDTLKDIPIGWALRYDAVKDEQIRQKATSVPKNQTLGILLEVTPQLASESGVMYKGDSSGKDWYSAQIVFLIGYSQADRKKLIDTVFKTFYDTFHYYPTFTVSWMIDGWSLEYINKAYGVHVHEITKEQYETDSYTLYGGIFNLPYYPSLTHPLIPAKTAHEGLDLLIIRQTISDIEKNYGSDKSFYTSQPNDYLKNPQAQNFDYFISLIDQLSGQEKSSQFGVLGLENSLEWDVYKDEYVKQLEYLWQKQAAEEIEIVSPFVYYNQFKNDHPANQTRVLKSAAFPDSGVLWYFSSNYRALLELWDGKLVLTDLRIFAGGDPYKNLAADKSRAYWVVPYLLDSSQEFIANADTTSPFRGASVRNDRGAKRLGIFLSQQKIKQVEIKNDDVLLIADTQEKIMFTPTEIIIEGATPAFSSPLDMPFSHILDLSQTAYFNLLKHPRFFVEKSQVQDVINVGWENKSQEKTTLAKVIKQAAVWHIVPQLDLTQNQIDGLSSIFQPDQTSFRFEPAHSTFFWHNQEAVAGKSAVRLFVDPRNIFDRPVAPQNFMIHVTGGDISYTLPSDVGNKMDSFLVDFTASSSAQAQVQLQVDGNVIDGMTHIQFYADCTKEWLTCMRNPAELKGFIKVILREKWQTISENIINLKQPLIKKLLPFVDQIKNYKDRLWR